MTERENFLRAIEGRSPEWVPIRFDLLPAIREAHGPDLEALRSRYPRVFGSGDVEIRSRAQSDALYRRGERFVDDWGCGWYNAREGILGQVVEHPLADWRALSRLRVPDPAEQLDWIAAGDAVAGERSEGRATIGHVPIESGGFFDRLQFLRGLENLLVDLLLEPPELARLMEILLDHNLRFIRRWLDLGIDVMAFHGDLGTQRGLLISPELFRRHLKPAYTEMFGLCRRSGVHVWYSSDGNLLEIVNDLAECGVSVHDPQVGAGTIEGIGRAYTGRMCAMVDLDEQLLPSQSPEEIHEQMRKIVSVVGSPEGGLMIYAGPSEDVPFRNLEAICSAWERYCSSIQR